MSQQDNLVELVQSVLQMAEEDNAVSSEESLLAFLLEYLPADTLRALAETLGCDPDDDEASVVRMLWEDRYSIPTNGGEGDELEIYTKNFRNIALT